MPSLCQLVCLAEMADLIGRNTCQSMRMVLPDRIELSTSPLPMECSGSGNHPRQQWLIRYSSLACVTFVPVGLANDRISSCILHGVRLRLPGPQGVARYYHKTVGKTNMSSEGPAVPHSAPDGPSVTPNLAERRRFLMTHGRRHQFSVLPSRFQRHCTPAAIQCCSAFQSRLISWPATICGLRSDHHRCGRRGSRGKPARRSFPLRRRCRPSPARSDRRRQRASTTVGPSPSST
jgi:hypothetical protein